MKKYFLSAFLFSFIFTASADYKPGKYALSKLGTIPEDSVAYPVYVFIESFRNKEVHKILDVVPEELLYNRDAAFSNFYLFCKREFKEKDLIDYNNIKFIIKEKKDSNTKIMLKLPRKGVENKYDYIIFTLSKINNRFKILRID